MTNAVRDAIQTKIDRINKKLAFNHVGKQLRFNGENGLIAIRICKGQDFDVDIKTISYRNSRDTILFLEAYEEGIDILDRSSDID